MSSCASCVLHVLRVPLVVRVYSCAARLAYERPDGDEQEMQAKDSQSGSRASRVRLSCGTFDWKGVGVAAAGVFPEKSKSNQSFTPCP